MEKYQHISARQLNYANISDLSPILKLPDLTFINLQYKDFKTDLIKIKNDFGVKVHNFESLDHYNNLDDVAALCRALDFVVSTKLQLHLFQLELARQQNLQIGVKVINNALLHLSVHWLIYFNEIVGIHGTVYLN